MSTETHILLDAGSGGKASQRLIADLFFRHFSNDILLTMDDAALLHVHGAIAMSTDSYTVTPLFFPGGSIGTLAIHGTVNDVAMLGAIPRYLSCAFIIEEGLEKNILESIVIDMAKAAQEAHIHIVTGDTKVVPRGMCDKIFINTTGIGEVITLPAPSGHRAQAGDAILLSGPVGNHGLTIMAQREGLSFVSDVQSDSAPLNELVQQIVHAAATPQSIHVLRDPTRGGLATTLNEIAEQSHVSILIEEDSIPIDESVRNGCSFLGLDPLYLANEGKVLCFVPHAEAENILQTMRAHRYGHAACRIGTVLEEKKPLVALQTPLGGKRLLTTLEGDQLPRIC